MRLLVKWFWTFWRSTFSSSSRAQGPWRTSSERLWTFEEESCLFLWNTATHAVTQRQITSAKSGMLQSTAVHSIVNGVFSFSVRTWFCWALSQPPWGLWRVYRTSWVLIWTSYYMRFPSIQPSGSKLVMTQKSHLLYISWKQSGKDTAFSKPPSPPQLLLSGSAIDGLSCALLLPPI